MVKPTFVTVLMASMFLKYNELQPLVGNKGWEEKRRGLREGVVKLYSSPLFSGASPNPVCTHRVPSLEGRHVYPKPSSEWMMACTSGPALLLVLPSLQGQLTVLVPLCPPCWLMQDPDMLHDWCLHLSFKVSIVKHLMLSFPASCPISSGILRHQVYLQGLWIPWFLANFHQTW